MSPGIIKLIAVQPSPLNPLGARGATNWTSIESKVGTRLPTDYKEYVGVFGAGSWAEFLCVLTPFYRWSHPESVDFFTWVKTRLSGLNDVHQTFPEFAPPFCEFPASGGLFPIGFTDNGGTICWQTEGTPDSWPVVILAEEYPLGYNKYDTSLTEFLADLLEGRLVPKTFPGDFYPIPRPAFVPYKLEA